MFQLCHVKIREGMQRNEYFVEIENRKKKKTKERERERLVASRVGFKFGFR